MNAILVWVVIGSDVNWGCTATVDAMASLPIMDWHFDSRRERGTRSLPARKRAELDAMQTKPAFRWSSRSTPFDGVRELGRLTCRLRSAKSGGKPRNSRPNENFAGLGLAGPRAQAGIFW